MTEDKKNPLGPTGDQLRANIARLRAERGMSKKQLSDRVGELGRPIPPLGITRLEAGTRRVDADDLMALAIALDVSPVSLLLPSTGDGGSEITGVGAIPARTAWLWALGEEPLDLHEAADPAERFEKARDFRHENQPHVPRVPLAELMADTSKLEPVWEAVSAARDAGASMDAVRSYIAFREYVTDRLRSKQQGEDDGPGVD